MDPRAEASAFEGERRHKPRSAQLTQFAFGLLALGALVVAVVHFGEIRIFRGMLAGARPQWMLIAAALQLCTYGFLAKAWQTILRRAGSEVSLGNLAKIAVTKLFADQVVPTAGMSGNMLLIQQLRSCGVPRGTAIAALLVSLIGYYAVYAGLALLMLLFLWLRREATALLSGLVTAFLFVALAIPSLALWLRRRGSAPLPPRLEQVPIIRNLLRTMSEAPPGLVGDRRLVARVGGWQALVFIADAATLAACMRGLGYPAGIGIPFVALMAASIAVTLAPLPLGLGSFEATATAMLSFLKVPVEIALAATLLLRLFTLWLPLLPGLILTRSAMSRRGKTGEGSGSR